MRVQLAVVFGVLSASAQAHPGHDHSHWLSDPIHGLTAVAVCGLAAIAVSAVAKAKRRAINNKTEEK